MAERVKVALVCSECDARNYRTSKNAAAPRLEMKKYCPHCDRHTMHIEAR